MARMVVKALVAATASAVLTSLGIIAIPGLAVRPRLTNRR